MRVVHSGFPTTFALFIAATAVSCGGVGAGRRLVSISVSPAVADVKNAATGVQFNATGTFNAPPITVSPLPVLWKGSWNVLPNFCIKDQGCAGINPQTGQALCGGIPSNVTITASAPADLNLPLDSQNVPMVSGTAEMNCAPASAP